MSEEIQLAISFGKNRWDTNWRPDYLSWGEFSDQKLQVLRRTNELMAAYDQMSPDQKLSIKDGPAFVGGFIRGGRRKRENIDSRSLFTLDADHCDKNFKFAVELILAGKSYAVYTTHSHRADKPRYRLIAPADREMSPDEYSAASRKLAQLIGMGYFDKTTFAVERLMYLPSCSKDAAPELDVFDGGPLSVDWLLSQYDDWRDPLQWPIHKDERGVKLRSGNSRMQDPRTKRGIVGAFCRCYSIREAIAEFLPHVYEPTDDNLRFTHIGSTSVGGLVVYDDYGGDTFAYSFHESDPICGREVNAFDLVRLHKFGQMDESVDETTTSVTELPSFVAMRQFAESLESVKRQQQADATLQLQEEFGSENFNDTAVNESVGQEQKASDLSQLKIPYGFKVIEGKLFEVKETKTDIKHIPVCDCIVAVSKRHVNLTDGTHGLDVVWKNGDEFRTVSNTRSTFMDSKKLINMADYGLPVHSGNARALATYLSQFESENSSKLATELVSNQMGWVKDGFLLGEQFIGDSRIEFLPKDAGDGQTAKGFHSRGDVKKTFEVLERVSPYVAVKMAVFAALAAPLLQRLGESPFIFELTGGTSRGKTTALRIAASIYGCPDEEKPGFFKQWNLTKVYIERYASTLNNLPLFIDDTKKSDPKMIPPTVYQFCSGQGRGRGSLKGSQIGATWCTVLLSTGEQKLSSFSKDGGAVGRILSLNGSPFESTNIETSSMVEDLNRIVSENYGHLAEPWIRYLMTVDMKAVKNQITAVSNAYKRLAANCGEVAMRLARLMAIIDVTGQLCDECFYTELHSKFELEQEWLKILAASTEIDRALEALEDVMGWITAHNRQFMKNDETAHYGPVLSGRITENEIIIISEQLDAFLQSKGYEPTSIAKAWKDNKWLNTEDGKTKKRVRLAGALTRVYSFNLQEMGWTYETPKSYSEFGESDPA